MSNPFTIQPITPDDRSWIRAFLSEHWGEAEVVSRGRVYSADQLPGFVAHKGEEAIGLITYHIEALQCEIITINSLVSGSGIGSALIETVHQEALVGGCRRLWLITTNDNLPALRFYQKRGFRLVAVHRDAIETSRKIKPQIPLLGLDGIPIRDEIELEIRLR